MYSVIDIGSNTVRLVVYNLVNGGLEQILNSKHTLGLASYVDRNNNLTKSGADRLSAVLKNFKRTVGLLPGCKVYPFATASLRNVKNGREVLERMREETGLDITIISGKEEALMDYKGALDSIPDKYGLVVDIGGGSTELVFCKNKKVLEAVSIEYGSLNLFRKYVQGVIPDKDEIADIKSRVKKAVEKAVPGSYGQGSWSICAVGGTARCAQKLHDTTSRSSGKHMCYNVSFLEKIIDDAEEQQKKFVRKVLQITPERIHTILPGVIILETVAKMYGSKKIITCQYGVREGYLTRVLEGEGQLSG